MLRAIVKFTFILSCLLLAQACGNKTYNSAAIYMSAHHDDWQLFMGRDFLNDVADEKCKVIVVLTTSGAPEKHFAFSREEGAIASVKYAVTLAGLPLDTFSGHLKIKNFIIPYYKTHNVTLFFLRLPDGNMKGEGFEIFGNKSLLKLERGEITDITTTDSANVFKSWDELGALLNDATNVETGNYIHTVTLHIPDTSSVINPLDHPDHYCTGSLALKAYAGKKWKRYLYSQYNNEYLAANLSHEDSLRQQQLFNAYNDRVTQLMGFCTTCYSNVYQTWCARLYKRELQ